MAKINEIDITSLTYQEGSAPATPASTKWKIYAKTDGFYQIDDAGTETSLSAGGGGVSVSRNGRTTAGASWLGPTTIVARKITGLTAGDVLMSIGMYIRLSAENVSGHLQVALYTDDSTGTSQPGNMLSVVTSTPEADEFVFDGNDERWFYVPVNAYIPTTDDYWIAFYIKDTNNFEIAYDTTGGTAATLANPGWFTEFGATGHSFTSQTYDLSMHALMLS